MEKTVHLYIDPDLCQSCIHCEAVRACRRKAIVQIDPDEQPYIEMSRCMDCRACLSACPFGAIHKTPVEWKMK